MTTWQGAVDLLSDQANFKVPWGPHTFQLTHHDYMLSGDKPANTTEREQVLKAMYSPQNTQKEIRKFFEAITADLINKNKRKLGNNYQIDIIQDIGNLASAKFTASYFGIPLSKDSAHDDDSFTVQEVFDIHSHLFEYVFLDIDLAKSYKHRVLAQNDAQKLAKTVQAAIHSAESFTGMIMSEIENHTGPSLPDFGRALIKRLLKNKSKEDLVWEMIPTQAGAVATLAQGWAQMIDFYLSDKYSHHWPDIVKLAQSDDDADFELLRKYMQESFRLSPGNAGALRVCAATTNIRDGDRTVSVPAGSPVFADFITAGRDPAKFPDPETVSLNRPDEDYIHFGWGPHACVGRAIATTAITAMLRAFARACPGVRSAPGVAGQMQKNLYKGVFPQFLSVDGASWENFPVSKKVLFNVQG